MNIKELFIKIADNLKQENGVIAVIYNSKGSTPTEVGRMMFIDSENTIGSIGGGIAEKKAIDRAREMLRKGETTVKIHIDLTGNEESDGVCGGEADILLINTLSKAELILIGAGHVNQAVKRYAESLGYLAKLFDVRENLPWDNYEIITSYDKIFEKGKENLFILIATHNHEEDEKALFSLMKNKIKYKYLGVVSSKRKFRLMKENIEKKGVKVNNDIFAPAGLNLNGNAPEEVALSIIAQIEKIYYNKNGQDLKDVKK